MWKVKKKLNLDKKVNGLKKNCTCKYCGKENMRSDSLKRHIVNKHFLETDTID